MKPYALWVLAACTSSSKMTPPAPTYTPTPKGDPTGTPVTQMIDSAGGTLTSADGRLDVTIPAGAFAAATAVTIQPITNHAPNGLGAGYRLSPEGTTFATPATLTFHLDPVAALAVDTSFIVTQYDDGTWWSQPMQARTADTISVPAPHFSDWSVAQTLQLTPGSARVHVSDAAVFKATVIPDDDNLLLASPSNPTQEPDGVSPSTINANPSWQVNGVEGGAPATGVIGGDHDQGNYTAPNTPPSPSTVVVSMTLEVAGGGKVIAPASADIYQQEVWNGSSDVTAADGSHIMASFTFAQDLSQPAGQTLHFKVMSGVVSTSGPPPPSGCTLTVSPASQQIQPNEGTMTADYPTPEADVTAMGDTVWQATYTTQCPNGPGSFVSAVQAEWWPLGPGLQPVTEQSASGIVDADISGGTSSGHVHLVRQ